jgi:hypothetical protein
VSMSAVHSVLHLTLLWATENACIYISIYSRSGSVSTCIVCLMSYENGCSTQRRGVPWRSVQCCALSRVCTILGGTAA